MVKYFKRLITLFGLFFLFYLSFYQNAYAYLDPGTGSYIFQLFVAALLGGLFTLKLFWEKIKMFFKKSFSKKERHESADK